MWGEDGAERRKELLNRIKKVQNFVETSQQMPLLPSIGIGKGHRNEVGFVCFIFTNREGVGLCFLDGLYLQKLLRVDTPKRLKVAPQKVIFIWELYVVLLSIIPPGV